MELDLRISLWKNVLFHIHKHFESRFRCALERNIAATEFQQNLPFICRSTAFVWQATCLAWKELDLWLDPDPFISQCNERYLTRYLKWKSLSRWYKSRRIFIVRQAESEFSLLVSFGWIQTFRYIWYNPRRRTPLWIHPFQISFPV